jgi:hypothetical protein
MVSITDFGVCDTGWGWLSSATELENPHFSEDGKTFYCTITLNEAVAVKNDLSTVAHGHEAGIYQISIDVETCKAQAVKL